jgi:hypothetical protein
MLHRVAWIEKENLASLFGLSFFFSTQAMAVSAIFWTIETAL